MPATEPCKHTRLAHVTNWIFDLDNTLYPPSADLFAQINQLMTGFIMRVIEVDETEAHRLRQMYWEEYGTTLAGLVSRHGVSADEFLKETHQLDLSGLTPDPELRKAIASLPGRLLIHTNGPRAHAARVLAARGLVGVFDQVIAIEDKHLIPKPQARAYDAFLELTGVEPDKAVMIEDHAENLAEPYRRGVVTVWLDHGAEDETPGYVSIRAHDLTEFLENTPELSS